MQSLIHLHPHWHWILIKIRWCLQSRNVLDHWDVFTSCLRICLVHQFYLTGQLLQTLSCTCEIGNERSQNNEWRWTLPYSKPCECTRVIMVGLNTWTPIRPFVPAYAKTSLLSNDINVIKEHYELQCNEESKHFGILP